MNRVSLNVNDYFNDRISLCGANVVNADSWVNKTSTVVDHPQVFGIQCTYEAEHLFRNAFSKRNVVNVQGGMCYEIGAERFPTGHGVRDCVCYLLCCRQCPNKSY